MALKLKFRTIFPALVTAASPLTLVKTGLAYAFGFDITALRTSLDSIYASVASGISSLTTTGTSGAATFVGGVLNIPQYISGVTSFNGATGAIVSYYPPQGRLTLASGVPVMGSSQAGCTTVYYTPYCGNMVPLYDGTNMIPTQFAEVSQLTTDATKSPAAVAASKIYDLFAWNDAGTKRVTRGPAWTNATTRGYTMTMVNGILLNTSLITNGPAALRGTWVATIASNASSTIDYIFGSAGSNGVAGVFNVWNAYNRVNVGCVVIDNSASYNYQSTTIRQAHASTAMQVSFVCGAQEDAVLSIYQCYLLNVAAATFSRHGIGVDSVTAFSAQNFCFGSGAAIQPVTQTTFLPAAGTHYVAALEQNGDGTNNNTYQNNGVNNVVGLLFQFRM